MLTCAAAPFHTFWTTQNVFLSVGKMKRLFFKMLSHVQLLVVLCYHYYPTLVYTYHMTIILKSCVTAVTQSHVSYVITAILNLYTTYDSTTTYYYVICLHICSAWSVHQAPVMT